MAAKLNAEALAAMQKDRNEGKRHVRHLLGRKHGMFVGVWVGNPDDPGCEGCIAARKWAAE